MTRHDAYRIVSGVIFGIVSLLQLYRAAARIPVQFGGIGIPVIASWLACAGAGAMSVWAFRSRKS